MKLGTALVTGASGYIGTNLCRRLIRDGWSVKVLLRRNGNYSSPSAKLKVINDIGGSPSLLAEEIRDCDIVFHLASHYLAAHAPADVPTLIESNVLFGARVLEAMKIAGVKRFVNTGTAWQNSENGDPVPVNLYAATKNSFQSIVDYYTSAANVHCITLKLFDTYGPHDPRKKLVHLLRQSAASGESLPMSPGEQMLHLVYIDDVVDAFIVAADRLMTAENINRTSSEVYVVDSDEMLSVRHLVNRVQMVVGRPIYASFGERPYRDREVMVPYSTGTRLPGWSPRHTLSEGLRRTIEIEES